METKQLTRLERFTFGKYKGKLISAIGITDPSYFIWLASSDMLNNISNEWQEKIKGYADTHKTKIYAGNYGKKYRL